MIASTIQCSVDIFPFEGGTYSLQGAQILSCSVSKRINDDSGSFSIVLAPGGPNGVDAPPYWSQIITPMSLCVIGMQRGNRSAITMVGVVTTASESMNWRTGSSVQRAITFSGRDYSYFFAMQNWYSLFYLSLFGVGAGILTQGLSSGPPDQVGSNWFSEIMKPTLSSTFVPYRGAKIPFGLAVGTLFQPYPVIIPFADFFMEGGGNWSGKFRSIFPFPWYEFFVTTAQAGVYKETAPGYPFSTRALGPGVTGGPVMVARVNPVPRLTSSASNTGMIGTPQFDGVDLSLWDALPSYTLDENALLQNGVTFDEKSALNFYLINPTYAFTTNGGSNESIIPMVGNFFAVGDRASINRYGFRPGNMAFSWLTDPKGIQGQQGGPTNLASLVSFLISTYCGYYHPTPLMARGPISMPLRPDILIGSKFTYPPWKGNVAYDFYVEGVDHNFIFGGQSQTTLQLSRGLPSYIYDDPALLLDVMTGNAQRLNNVYVSGLPAGSATPLQAIPLSAIQNFLTPLVKPYLTPQSP